MRRVGFGVLALIWACGGCENADRADGVSVAARPDVPPPPSAPAAAILFPIAPMADGSGRYVMRGHSLTTFFTPEGFAFAVSSSLSHESWGLHCTLLGGRTEGPVAREEQPARVHVYRGASSSAAELPTYRRLVWQDIYPGVDLIAEPARGGVAYRFELSPGAKVSDIVMHWTGATALRPVEKGRGLDIDTAIGVLQVRGLRAFAIEGNRRVELAARHVVKAIGRGSTLGADVALEIGGWDGLTPLVIDPAITWSSYLGGSGAELGYGIAVDQSGNAFITGKTGSADFPTVGGFDTTYGTNDAFVAKLSSSGSLSWSSYLGGSGFDEGRGVAVDSSGNVFVAGSTHSTDFPSSGGFDTTASGPDGFVTKVSGSGALIWSSYLGGSSDDQAYGIAVDGSGNAFVTGDTQSADFPSTGGFATSKSGGPDAFVTKVSAVGSLVWSSYLGGGSTDIGEGIAIDSNGNAFVTGTTYSSNFPSTGGFDTSLGGSQDGFVTKVSASGALLWSSYVGGGSSETSHGIAVDGSGNAFVIGGTDSSDFPSSGGFDTALGGTADGFLTKLSGSGVLLWSSYLGGGSNEQCQGVAVDGSGDVFVTGQTTSTDFPSSGGFDTALGGTGDAFVTKVSGAGVLLWSSYLGGNASDDGKGIAVDGNGDALVTGQTNSADFPTMGGFDTSLGGYDAFVTKLGFASLGAPCASGSGCDSSFCANGVCCDQPCTGSCTACTAALKGTGSDGTCGPISGCTDAGTGGSGGVGGALTGGAAGTSSGGAAGAATGGTTSDSGTGGTTSGGAGGTSSGGVGGTEDAGSTDGGNGDAGEKKLSTSGDDGGCGCRAPGTHRTPILAWLIAAALVVIRSARSRRERTR